MTPRNTINRLLGISPALDELTFEALADEARLRPEEVHDEFVRRLFPLVFQAAEARFLQRGRTSHCEPGQVAQAVFLEFAPEFASGDSKTVLLRFASAICRVLGREAFESIALRYYTQLPIYHIKDDEQRRVLAATYQKNLGLGALEQLADRFNVPVHRMKCILTFANAALEAVIENGFGPGVLDRLTAGYISNAIR